MTILGVSGLTKRFGANTVIAGIDLDVKKGERIAVLGASGSGKSTLLRCLNFMEMPDAGTITLDGKVIGRREAELTLVRQRIGMVFQQFNLFPHMTALGNVMEGLRTVRRMSKPDAQARAERSWRASDWPTRRRTIRRTFRADRSSASPSPARWPWIPSCCCSTSRPPRSIPSWSARF